MKVLKIETETGIENIANIDDWGWQKETGDLYYRQNGKLAHISKCLSAEEIHLNVFRGKEKNEKRDYI